jgi:hypothetical protein
MKSEPMFEDGVAAEAWLYEAGAIVQALRQTLASGAISGLQLPGAHRTSALYHTQSPHPVTTPYDLEPLTATMPI